MTRNDPKQPGTTRNYRKLPLTTPNIRLSWQYYKIDFLLSLGSLIEQTRQDVERIPWFDDESYDDAWETVGEIQQTKYKHYLPNQYISIFPENQYATVELCTPPNYQQYHCPESQVSSH